MQKVLAVISNEDKEKGVALSALLATYKTILQINDYEIDKAEVKHRIDQTQGELTEFWMHISEKYMFPLYLSKPMKVDYEKNVIYIDE